MKKLFSTGRWTSAAAQVLPLFVAILAAMASSPTALAQSVTISPSGYLAVAANSSTPFKATVTGLSSTAVTWSVAGSAATYGSISPTGVYAAPATPPGNPAQITATSVANTSVKATQSVYFLAPGPTITQVTPNPIPVGTANITITGTGFQKNALFDYSITGGSPIQSAATFVNSTTLTGSIYTASATTVTIYVMNPGTAPSNSLSIPVGSAPPPSMFTLTVVNGSNSGIYAAGTVVNITASSAPAGEAFSSWSGATVASATSPSTSITMPAANTTVTANYTAVQTTYTLTYAGNGSTSGFGPSDPNQYSAGQPVTVLGNLGYLFNPGHSFIGWNTAANGTGTSYGPGATLSIGSSNVTLYAQWNNQDWPVSVWGGARDAITLKADGTVWTWGLNAHGQLGNGNTTDQSVPVQVLGPNGVGNLTGITAVMGGEQHNLALKSDGTVWSWGNNMSDQLGDGNANDSSTPVQVSSLSSIVQIASRGYHSVAVKSDGTLWAWGWDYHGALGNGVSDQNYDFTVPVQVQGVSNPIMVSTGYCFSVALLQNHTLVAWGNNANGELGNGTTTDQYTPVPVVGLNNVIWVSAGWTHVVAIKSDGTVWTWGANTWTGSFPGAGLLGDGTTADHYTPEQVQGLAGAIQAFGGDASTSVLLSNGTVWTFGSNGAGQLGTGSFTPAQSLVPVQVQGLSNVVMMTLRDFHNQAILNDGSVWSWGSGLNGELGNGTMQNSAVPVEVIWGSSGGGSSSYTLTVANGTVNGAGSASFAAGAMVTIVANAPAAGQQFSSWTGATVASATSPTTTLTMPAANTTVTATYAAITPATYTLTVANGTVNGASTGSFAASAMVTIVANAPASGQQFNSWTGATVTNASSSTTTLTMPAANTTVTATYAAAGGPTITSVSPNPLPTGTVTVTITGTGFGSSSNIWDGGVQYGSQLMGNTLTTSVYTAPGTTSATFTVHNPGVVSNAVVVPVGNAAPTYTLSVVNGTVNGAGSGSFAAGTPVTIVANAPPSGQQFTSWTGATVTNASASTTTLTMPASNTTVTATYSAATYTLTVVNGTVNGSSNGIFAAAAMITIVANAPPAGQQFSSWTGATVTNASASTTTLTMPAANTTVTATYSAATYTLTVVNGTVNGSSNAIFAAGAMVTIVANAPPAGQTFTSWTGATVTNAAASTTTLTMPASNTTVTATYSATTYTLTVVNGTVNGSSNGIFAAGAMVTIVANAPRAGQQFSSWTGATVTAASAPTTTLTMPAANTTVTATYASTGGLTITSVSPNPLPTGTVTVTITGTGFSSSSNIWDSGVQYGAQQPTANTLTTSVYTGQGTASATFTVHDSGSISNAVTVPVSGPPTYTLTVVNGTVGGQSSASFLAGAVVTIIANAPAAGQSFSDWTGATVSNAAASTTSITMPAANTTVTANYATGPTYLLTVVSGQNGGNYAAGTPVTIIANNPPAGQSFLGWTGATVTNANSPTTTLTMPAAATTVTANFTQPTYTLSVVNGTNSGTYAPGQVVPISPTTAPAGEYFQQWTGPGLANASQPSTTVTMPQSNITVTANFYTPAPIPQPVTTHPRLWVTPADLPRLQGWATSTNPIYPALQQSLGVSIGHYLEAFPGDPAMSEKNPTPNSSYPDLGDTQGYQGILSEEDAMILAFNSLIDPNPAKRIQYAQAARNLLMYALNLAALGHLESAPFRDPEFAIYNRASYTGHEWPLAVDWIYNTVDANGNPILTAADKAVIQSVFIQWSSDDSGADDIGNNPQPSGIVNSPQLLPGNRPFRWASNNYYLGHARNLTMMALAIDPIDDPPVNPLVSPTTIGNSLRSFILDGNGAWLYQIFAMMGDPQTVVQAYNIPNNPTGAGFGLSSGGLPPEGFLYGESYGYLLGHLLALQTAGFNDPALSGPQIGLIGAPVWDRYVKGYLSSLTPAAQVNPAATYYGEIYQFAGYGDMLREYVTPDFMRPFALLALLEQENGSSQHVDAARWFVTNAPTGGASTLLSRVVDQYRVWGGTDSVLSFLLFDPAAPAAADPRPTYPTLFYDAPAGRVVAHTDWTPNGTMFSYKASWESINHQDATGGQFELYRKGEWLTKEMSNYDNNAQGLTTLYHNTLALQNTCVDIAGAPATPTSAAKLPCGIQWNEPTELTNGSQWMWGEAAGDPTTISSNGPGYVYAASDLTPMYNRPSDPADAATQVTEATRSVLWLNNVAGGDYIVVYDRAATMSAGLFKQFNLSLVTAPVTQTSNGVTTATETMADGQQLFIQTLLPQNPQTSYFNGAAMLNPIAELEPTQYIYQVQDPAMPVATRFLHVLQGADANVSMAPAAYLQSTGGTAFDGAQFANVAVFFPVNGSTTPGSTTLSTPQGVHTVLVTGLTPGAGYTVVAAQATIQVSPGGSQIADAAGVLMVTL